MNISINIQLGDKEKAPGSPEDLAKKVLKAVGGSEKKDTINLHISPTPMMATVGATALPSPPEEV